MPSSVLRGLSIIFLLSSGRNWSFHLQVLERKSLGCYQPEDGAKYLITNQGGNITCPGLSCSNNTDVIWYMMKQKVVCVSELKELWRNTHQFKLKWCVSPSGYQSCLRAAQTVLRVQRLAASLPGQHVWHWCVFLWQTNHRQLDLSESR